MKVVVQSSMSGCNLPLRDRLLMFQKAGFTAYDISVYREMAEGGAFCGEEYLAAAHEHRAYADSLGLICDQFIHHLFKHGAAEAVQPAGFVYAFGEVRIGDDGCLEQQFALRFD